MEEIKEMLQRIIDTLERIEKNLPECKTVKTTVAIGGEELRVLLNDAPFLEYHSGLLGERCTIGGGMFNTKHMNLIQP